MFSNFDEKLFVFMFATMPVWKKKDQNDTSYKQSFKKMEKHQLDEIIFHHNEDTNHSNIT